MSRGCVALAILLASVTQVRAYNAPKLADGKTPDLRGIWQVRDTAYLNIEGHPASAGVAAAASIIVDPPDHLLPYNPAALTERNATVANGLDTDPSRKCYEAGVPRATYLPTPFLIAQSVGPHGGTAFVYQDNHAFRIVYPASKPHTDGIDWWMGDSRGRWDGATLVVDGTNYNHLAWLDAAGNHHSDDMHVVERYTRTGPDTMQYEARIEDPTVFTRPWTLRETLYRDNRSNARIAEDECLDDRNGVRHHVAPTDPANLQHNRYTRWAIAQKMGLLSTGTDISTPPGETPGSTSGTAPNPPAPTGPVPRLPDGHPDFKRHLAQHSQCRRAAAQNRRRGRGRQGSDLSCDCRAQARRGCLARFRPCGRAAPALYTRGSAGADVAIPPSVSGWRAALPFGRRTAGDPAAAVSATDHSG